MSGASPPAAVRRGHHMPFGAELREDGRVRFALWAPAARSVKVRLETAPRAREVELARLPDGRHRAVLDDVPAGTRYRFVIDDRVTVPDPASRFQPEDVHGPSEVIDPRAFAWRDGEWCGRPWEEAVVYELHVGTFTPQGTFAALERRLDHLLELGVSAIELMPVADFPGRWNWGYDGVLPFAPDSRYGRPEDLKRLVDSAHAAGLMVLLDVVYNHFGPEGNWLQLYAPGFFTERHRTPWGAAIDFDGPESHMVRQFFVHNALYWLEEYHLDGLRLDAVHAIVDDSEPHILEEIAQAVAAGPGAGRHVHLVLENDDNAAHLLARDDRCRPRAYTAQWNDDLHHALHVLVCGETSGYYEDYADDPLGHLARCLTEGFAWQGEPSRHRGGRRRGEPTRGVPLVAFVAFLQNHDQVGNRAFGERITRLAGEEAVRAATALLLLAPSPPLLFMGQEWAAEQPFLFFCDLGPELAPAVREGRRREFARFPEFADPAARERIPDPCDPATFRASVLDWSALGCEPHRRWLALHRALLEVRRREVMPRLSPCAPMRGEWQRLAERALAVSWPMADGARLTLLANLGAAPVGLPAAPAGRVIWPADATADPGRLDAWTVVGTVAQP